MLRRAFILLGFLHFLPADASPPADVVFVNGVVYTLDPARSWASAVVIAGEYIAYVGDDQTAQSFIGPGTRVVDLQHRMLLPGFQDSHVHPAAAPNPATSLILDGLTRRTDVFDRIRRYARAHPEKRWIVGSGWSETAFLPNGLPTRQMLDALIPDRPAYLVNNSGHGAWVNSEALKIAHITATTPDPPNGRIDRDAVGQPTGGLQEYAMQLIEALIPPPSSSERIDNLSAALEEMVHFGFTAIEDAFATAEVVAAYRAVDRRGSLPLRANLCLGFRPSESDDAQIQWFLAQRKELAGHRLRADCVKILLDGVPETHTAALLEPYSDDPKYGSGKLFLDKDRLDRIVTRLDAAGFQVHMHTIGDAAVRAALESIAAARRSNGFRDNRHTLAHLGLIDPADLPRFRALGVIANMTPLWSRGDDWERVFAPVVLGRERSQRVLQTRTLLDSGAILVWGSDWPVTGVSPLDGIETAITHRFLGGRDSAGKEDPPWSPQERVNLEQALVAYTSAGAYLLHDPARGTVATGNLADLVVIDRNLFAIDSLDIHNAKVDMTVIGGKIVYARGAD